MTLGAWVAVVFLAVFLPLTGALSYQLVQLHREQRR